MQDDSVLLAIGAPCDDLQRISPPSPCAKLLAGTPAGAICHGLTAFVDRKYGLLLRSCIGYSGCEALHRASSLTAGAIRIGLEKAHDGCYRSKSERRTDLACRRPFRWRWGSMSCRTREELVSPTRCPAQGGKGIATILVRVFTGSRSRWSLPRAAMTLGNRDRIQSPPRGARPGAWQEHLFEEGGPGPEGL